MRDDIKNKQKDLAKMRFIYKALQRGYIIKRNDDTYSFTIDKNRDELLSTFNVRFLNTYQS